MTDNKWESRKPPGIDKSAPKKTKDSSFTLSPELWEKCPRCATVTHKTSLAQNAHVCPKCNYHFRITAEQRLSLFVDKNSFDELDAELSAQNPLNFVDSKAYPDRLKENKLKTALKDSILTGSATLNERRIFVGAFEFKFMGGSMGSVTGEKIARLFDYGKNEKCPVIIFSSSGGARMQEGILSLMQMAKTTAAFNEFAKAKLPFISVMCDPTTGGVSASFASLGDICIAEPGASIGFAGARVIEQTIKQKLPEGFQTAEFLLEHGMLDAVVERQQLRDYINKILMLLIG